MGSLVLANRKSDLSPVRSWSPLRPLRRELILRTNDGICFLTISPWWHRMAALAAVAFVAAGGVLGWQYAQVKHRLAVNDVEIVQVADAYQSTIDHLQTSISALETTVAGVQQDASRAQEAARTEAERRQAAVSAMNAENEALRQRLETLRSEMESARVAAEAEAARTRMPVVIRGGERTAELQDALVERLRVLEGQMRTVGRGNAQVSGAAAMLQRHIEDIEAARVEPSARGSAAGEIQNGVRVVPGLPPAEILRGAQPPVPRPEEVSVAIPPLDGEGDFEAARNRAHLGVQMLSSLVRRTGVSPERALAIGGASYETGGAFVPLRASARSELRAMQSELMHYGATAGRLADLTRLVRSMPFGRPLFDIEVVSGFGPRADPFNGQMAMHAGLDLRAAPGTPVQAAGPGVVTIADTNGEYGRLVEISHGFGVRTRYGHLSRIDVTTGDRVEIGQIVGAVGSTGRSTGPHLHYEILFQQANLDPAKFLEVSRHVLANVQRRVD